MNAIEHRLAQVAKELLTAYKPEDVPEAFTIRAAYETSKVEKPYICASVANGKTLHKFMRKMDLVLTSHLREGEEDTAPDTETHQKFVNVLEANMEELGTRLAAVGLRLRKILDADTGEEIEAGRTITSSTAWTVTLQIVEA